MQPLVSNAIVFADEAVPTILRNFDEEECYDGTCQYVWDLGTSEHSRGEIFDKLYRP
jgi:hypothetical protein